MFGMRSGDLAGVVLVAVVGQAAGQQVTLQYLGLAGGGQRGDLNDFGQAAFVAWDGERQRVGRYTEGIGVEYVDPVGMTSPNWPRIGNSGQVSFTGTMGGTTVALRYTDGVGVQNLNTLGAAWAVAVAMNDMGEVAGGGYLSGGYSFGWRYSDAAGMVPVAGPGQAPGMTHAVGINNSGQVAGTWESALSPARAVRFTPGIGIQELGTLGGSESVATGINRRGDVFGWSEAADGMEYNFVYSDQSGMINLGTTAISTLLVDMNDAGWIVGTNVAAWRAVVWTPLTGYVELDSLLPAGTVGGFTEALGVNNAGQILAHGSINGQFGLFRVTVHELPSAGTLVPLAAMGAVVLRRRRS